MPKTDPYKTLGLSRGASPDEISAAYIELNTKTTDQNKLTEIEEAYAAIAGVAAGSRTAPARRAYRAAEPQFEAAADEEEEGAYWEDQDEEEAEGDYDENGEDSASEPKIVSRSFDMQRTPQGQPQKRTTAAVDLATDSFDPYRALNLTPKASPAQIRASYNRLMSMTRRPGRRAEIERAFEILTGKHGGLASPAPGTRPQAKQGRAGSRPAAHSPRERGEYLYDQPLDRIPPTRAKARRERKWEEQEWRSSRRAKDDVDPNRQYWYAGLVAVVVIVVAAMVISAIGGGFGSSSPVPTDFVGLVDRGNNDFDNKNWASAENWYAKALAINPENNDVRTDYAVSLFYQGKTDAAINEYQTVLAKEPTKFQTLLNLGIALESKTPPDINGAVAAWQKVVDTSNNAAAVEQAKSNIAKYRK